MTLAGNEKLGFGFFSAYLGYHCSQLNVYKVFYLINNHPRPNNKFVKWAVKTIKLGRSPYAQRQDLNSTLIEK
ncbi:hypothetical protein V3O24_10460 [Methylobacter sp. Wu8]|mgnify:CR=1 FL=1|uniref:hypothetical protein n=1 Tax=Methylobacter sp. Wu8 TaxID=3118457 RepID=UPI002F2D4970